MGNKTFFIFGFFKLIIFLVVNHTNTGNMDEQARGKIGDGVLD